MAKSPHIIPLFVSHAGTNLASMAQRALPQSFICISEGFTSAERWLMPMRRGGQSGLRAPNAKQERSGGLVSSH